MQCSLANCLRWSFALASIFHCWHRLQVGVITLYHRHMDLSIDALLLCSISQSDLDCGENSTHWLDLVTNTVLLWLTLAILQLLFFAVVLNNHGAIFTENTDGQKVDYQGWTLRASSHPITSKPFYTVIRLQYFISILLMIWISEMRLYACNDSFQTHANFSIVPLLFYSVCNVLYEYHAR